MYQHSILIILLFSQLFCFSQECKYEKNGIDKFTGKGSIITKSAMLVDDLQNKETHLKIVDISFKGFLKDDATGLYIMISTGINSALILMGQSAKLTLLLDDKSSITLNTIGDWMDEFISDGNDNYQSRYFVFETGDVEKVIGHKITDIRVTASQSPFDSPVAVEQQMVISDLLKCIKSVN